MMLWSMLSTNLIVLTMAILRIFTKSLIMMLQVGPRLAT